MTPLTAQQVAAITQKTGITVDELNDLAMMKKADQALVVKGYQDMDWVKDKSVLAEVIAGLAAVVPIMGDVGTVAGGILGVITLLKLFL
jgi:hypothetical protein